MATDKRFSVPDDIAVRVPAEAMQATCCDIFRHFGMDEAEADQAAEVLVWADLRGIDSHGVSNMMPFYVRGFRDGTINPAPDWKVIREAPGVATVDSDRGLGLSVGPRCMELAIEKARNVGIGAVSVTNGRHFGAAGYHAAMALEHDMVGLAMTVGGIQVAPTFGAKALVGLNPLAIAVPARYEAPFLFDASMSSVAGNKIRIAQRLGAPVAGGWIADVDGTPIMEESPVPEHFLMLPLGGTREIGSHKGYSLAVMVDVLCGLLAGTGPGYSAGGVASHHFLAYRIDAFTDLDQFKDQMDVYLRDLRECPPAPGQERVIYAGLDEFETEQDRSQHGIPYHPDVVAWYRKTAQELGLPDRLTE